MITIFTDWHIAGGLQYHLKTDKNRERTYRVPVWSAKPFRPTNTYNRFFFLGNLWKLGWWVTCELISLDEAEGSNPAAPTFVQEPDEEKPMDQYWNKPVLTPLYLLVNIAFHQLFRFLIEIAFKIPCIYWRMSDCPRGRLDGFLEQQNLRLTINSLARIFSLAF